MHEGYNGVVDGLRLERLGLDGLPYECEASNGLRIRYGGEVGSSCIDGPRLHVETSISFC